MAKCREVEPLFTPYVDGEAGPEERATLDAHLTKCPPCRSRVAGERTAREVLKSRRGELGAPAPPPLRARCAASAAAASRGALGGGSVASVIRHHRWVPLSLAATLVLAVGWVFLFGINNKVEALAAQLAMDHVKCFRLPMPRVPPDAAAASREWSASQGWALAVPSSAPSEQLELLGVRRCLSSEGRVAHVMYRWRGAPVSVFVLNHAVKERAAEEIIPKLGEQTVIWTAAGRTYAVVGRGSPSDLQHLAAYVRRNAE